MLYAKRLRLLLAVLGVLLGVNYGAYAQERVTKQYPLKDFSAIELKMTAQVSVTQGESFWVKADVQGKEYLAGLEVEVKGNRLIISADRELQRKLERERRFPVVRLQVTLPDLKALHLSGMGEILLTSSISGEGDFEVNLSGSGDVVMRNVTMGGKVALNLNGSGDINALRVKGSSVAVKLNGSGDIVLDEAVECTEGFLCDLTGSGNVRLSDITAGSLRLQLSGSGDISARMVQSAGNIDVLLNGTGEIQGDQFLAGGNVLVNLTGSGGVGCRVMTGQQGDFRVVSSGEISVRERGTMESYSVLLSGSGDVVLAKLSGGQVEVKGSGSGDVSVNAREQLKLDGVRGSMGVSYAGDACVKILNSRSVSLTKLD